MSILPIRELDELVIGYLGFWAERRLNQVNRHYRARLNARFAEMMRGKRQAVNQLRLMIQANNLEACQWIMAREKQPIPTLKMVDLLNSQNIPLIRFILGQAAIGRIRNLSYPIFKRLVTRREQLLLIALQTNNLALADYLLTDLPGFDSRWNRTQSSLLDHLDKYQLETVQWIENFYLQHVSDHPLFHLSQVPALAKLILANPDARLMDWLQQKTGFDWARFLQKKKAIPALLGREPFDPNWLTELQSKYGYFLEPEQLLAWAVERKKASLLGWLLGQGDLPILTPAIMEKAASSLDLLVLIYYAYPPQLEILRPLWDTRTMRYPPYSPAVYAWLEQRLTKS